MFHATLVKNDESICELLVDAKTQDEASMILRHRVVGDRLWLADLGVQEVLFTEVNFHNSIYCVRQG